jgi:hypothetical protein
VLLETVFRLEAKIIKLKAGCGGLSLSVRQGLSGKHNCFIAPPLKAILLPCSYLALRSAGDKGTTCKNPSHTIPDPPNQLADRERHRPSKNVKLKLHDGALPQSHYEGDGEFCVGRKVLKDFGGTNYRGVVSNCDVEWPGGETWEIACEDVDAEDLNHKELMEILLPGGKKKGGGGGF